MSIYSILIILNLPFFFPTKNISAVWNNFKGLIYPFLNCSSMKSYTSSFSSLNNRCSFPFLCTNSLFTFIIWSHIFFFWQPLTHLFSKFMNLFVELLRNQFLSFFLRLCYFFLLIPNLLFFYYLFHFYYYYFFWFFLLFFFFILFFFFLLLPLFLFLFFLLILLLPWFFLF